MFNVYNELERLVVTVPKKVEAEREAERVNGFFRNVRTETTDRIMDTFDYRKIGYEKMYIKNGIYIFINKWSVRVWEDGSLYNMADIPYNCRDVKALYKIISHLERLRLTGFIGPEEDL